MDLSLRMSCDRCRAHKLKCSGPARSKTCQRCERAKVACVFGRRASSRRRPNERGAVDQRSPKQKSPWSPIMPAASTPVNLASPQLTATSAASETATYISSFSGLDLDGQLGALTEATKSALPAILQMDNGSFDDPDRWDSLLHSVDPDVLESDSNTVAYDWLQAGCALDQSPMLGPGHSDLAPWSQLESTTPTDCNNALTASSTAGSAQSSNAFPPGQRLTSLVAEIQQQLKTLQEGPWHTDSTCSLDDYPVGAILGLAKEFSALAGPILSRKPCVSGGLEEDAVIGEDEIDIGRMTSSTTGDTPTILLVMCAYTLLVRIYTIVMGHFQNYLQNGFANRHQRFGTATSECMESAYSMMKPISDSAVLRLGELPFEDSTHTLQQMYTAVRMLLDAMHDIEGHLGREAAMARAMTVASLLQSGRCKYDSFAVLEKQATAVKELLRENMGL